MTSGKSLGPQHHGGLIHVAQESDGKCEGFNEYLVSANAAGMDVNDWIEDVLGWYASLPVLNRIVFPYLNKNSVVCELGPGTGRFSRHILPRIPEGVLHLFDHSTWIQSFLKQYFVSCRNVQVYHSDGRSIGLADNTIDLIFSNGMFTLIRLGEYYLYAQECKRIIKPGGYLIFNFVDISREKGWELLEAQSEENGHCFCFHCGHTVEKLFNNAGFSVEERFNKRAYTFVVLKNDTVD